MTVLPEVNFTETDPELIQQTVVEAYESLSGRKLAVADPVRLFLLSMADVIVQLLIKVNDTGKQNLLYYSRDKVLDHKGFPWNTPRIESKAATTTMKINMSTQQPTAITIKKGELVTGDGEVFFALEKDVLIMPNELSGFVSAICTQRGTVGNGYAIGKINTLVKPLPFVQSVENITISDGGAEVEEDEPYRARIHQAPEKLSTAGPTGAYEFWAKSASSLIVDVYAYSPAPGISDVRILLEGGHLPSPEIIDSVYEILNDRKIRPLTDNLNVGAPDVIEYELDVIYYIETNTVDMVLIQKRIEEAIRQYEVWQRSKIGRDINPSKLISDCIRAGAKRVEVNSPLFTKVEKGQVAQAISVNVVSGGDEDY